MKFILFLVLLVGFASCTPEDNCETETVCYGEGNCIEKPIPGSCFN